MKKILLVFVYFLNMIICGQTPTLPVGAGTSGDPYQIASLGNLYWIYAPGTVNGITQEIRRSLIYIQIADIDASETAGWFSDGASGFYGWKPMGDNNLVFTGSYNGQGYKISNLYINRPNENYIGLFGMVVWPTTLQNIKLQSINVTGNASVGGLAGQSGFTGQAATILYCSADGVVTGGAGLVVGGLVGNNISSSLTYSNFSGSVTGKGYVGGLSGDNVSSTLSKCYSTANVTCTGTSGYVGGLMGHAYSSSVVTLCYATGNVSSIGDFTGGFIGASRQYSSISNCYATGSVTGVNYVGGFAGLNGTYNAVIDRVYSKGAVSGTSLKGGLIGYANGGATCYNSFWDNQTSLQSSSAGGISTSTANMQTQSTFANSTYQWDFVGETAYGSNDYWNISGTKNSGYPYLNWQTFASVTFTDGSVFSQSLTNGSSNQAIGRFSLNGSLAGGSLNTVIIKLNGIRSGASNFKLWLSTDNIFDGSDTQIGSTVAADPGEGNTVTFSSLSSTIGTSAGYFFLTCDLTAGADGTIQPIIVDNNALTLSNADLTGTITNSTLAGSTSPLPIELISFSAEVDVSFVLLNWQTATEVNNYGFVIERAIKNEKLEIKNWAKLGFIEGNGNSNSPKNYIFIDETTPSGTVQYRLKQIDNDGAFKYSNIITVESGHAPSVPTEFILYQNYPNPFNPATTIKYSIPSLALRERVSEGRVRVLLKIYDILGNEVATLVNENKAPGYYEVGFNASGLSSGVYIYKLNIEGYYSAVKKLVVIK